MSGVRPCVSDTHTLLHVVHTHTLLHVEKALVCSEEDIDFSLMLE